ILPVLNRQDRSLAATESTGNPPPDAIQYLHGGIAMKKAFDHIGIITLEPRDGESWVADSEVWVTNPRLHPQRIEYIRPKKMPDVPDQQVGLWKLWHWPHV